MGVNNIRIDGVYISEIYRWYTEHALIVNRRYQRKLGLYSELHKTYK